MARADVRKKAASSSAAAGAGTPASAPAEPPIAFEAALAQLEEVVDRLEGGELDLEVALASFEQGVRLTRQCAEQLDTAERRIEVLMKEGDGLMVRPFEGGPADDLVAGDAPDSESGED
jgi:exodeoxyribonuclease VII small subunit